MNIQHIFVILLCLITFDVTAQRSTEDAAVYWGNEYREPASSLITKIIGKDPQGLYALRLQGRTGFYPHIEKYDDRLNLKKSKQLSLSYKGRIREFEDIFMIKDKIYLFTSFNNEDKKTNYLFMEEVDKTNFQATGDIKIIGKLPTKGRYNEGAYQFEFTRDSSKVLLYHQMPFRGNDTEHFALSVYNANMELEWKKDVVLPFSDKLFTVLNFRVDDQGNAYIMGKLYNDTNREKRDGKPNYQFVVLSYLNDGQTERKYKINFEDKFISELTFRVASNGDLVCAGFYSDRNSLTIQGTCFFRINAQTQELYKTGFKAFEPGFMARFLTDKQIRQGKGLFNYSLDRLILRSDGGALLVAEQYFVRQDRTFNTFGDPFINDFNDPINNRIQFIYNYHDLIVVNINPDGSIAWANKVPKRQVSVDDGGYFSSYAMSVVRDKIYIVYNDHPKNANELDPQRILNYNGRNSVVTMAILGADGSFDKYALFSNQDASIITRPKVARQISRNEMIIYGERNKMYRFGKLYFQP